MTGWAGGVAGWAAWLGMGGLSGLGWRAFQDQGRLRNSRGDQGIGKPRKTVGGRTMRAGKREGDQGTQGTLTLPIPTSTPTPIRLRRRDYRAGEQASTPTDGTHRRHQRGRASIGSARIEHVLKRKQLANLEGTWMALRERGRRSEH